MTRLLQLALQASASARQQSARRLHSAEQAGHRLRAGGCAVCGVPVAEHFTDRNRFRDCSQVASHGR